MASILLVDGRERWVVLTDDRVVRTYKTKGATSSSLELPLSGATIEPDFELLRVKDPFVIRISTTNASSNKKHTVVFSCPTVSVACDWASRLDPSAIRAARVDARQCGVHHQILSCVCDA
jgi:hypothetical protein